MTARQLLNDIDEVVIIWLLVRQESLFMPFSSLLIPAYFDLAHFV